jgi:RNA polymerase sigma-70 factor (ECF subfamily)
MKVLADADVTEGGSEFEAFFLQHYPRIYGVLFRLTGDHGEAEDLALEAFLRLWRRSPAQTENTGGWLSRVAVRLGYNALRSRKRRTHYEEQAGSQEWLRRLGPNPQQTVERTAQRRAVHDALRRMRSRGAQLLILYHSGYSYREIAAALNLNPHSIGTLLTRAEREFLRMYRNGE